MAATVRMTALAPSVPLSALPSAVSSAVALPPNEIWYVATTSGVRTLSLDALERELASGELDVSTQVWIPGMAEWERLGSVANLEDGPPLDQGPGIPPYHASGRGPGLVEVAAPEPSVVAEGPLSESISPSDPSDPNHALWASIAPRSSRPVQSGIWRKADLASPARRQTGATLLWQVRWQILCAAFVTGVVLKLLSVLVATS